MYKQGDSGGPLSFKSSNQHILIGVTSFGPSKDDDSGPECDKEGAFTVFARISELRKWVEGKMDSPKFCDSGPDVKGRF